MEQPKKKEADFKKFKRAQPKAVSLLDEGLVRIGSLDHGSLPAVFEPASPDVDLAVWVASHREVVEDNLLRHGAILFRGFGMQTADDFEKLARSVCPELYGDYGDLPKSDLGDTLYRSTPYPADKTILFHNESSHTPRWPMRQFFFCVKASHKGGETPIVDCRKLYQKLDPEVRERFADKGLRYVRNFTEGFDVRWQDFFKTEDRSVVEEYCRANGVGCEWKEDGGLRIWQNAPAVAHHPQTGEPLFFNQVQLHHVACLDPEVRKSLQALFQEEDLPRNVVYGDGSPISEDDIRHVSDLYWETSVAFPWQEGDIIALDNMLIAHARNPFEGERRILVAMGRMFDRHNLSGPGERVV